MKFFWWCRYTHFNFPEAAAEASAPPAGERDWLFFHKKEFYRVKVNKEYLQHLQEKPLVVEVL